MAERFTVVPSVYVALRRDDKVLLIRRANTGHWDGWYALPAGHVDGNEPAHAAAAREAYEEVGVTIDLADLRLVHVLHRVADEGGYERVDLIFETRRWSGEPYNAEPEKCDDVRWFSLGKLPKKTAGAVRAGLAGLDSDSYFSAYNF